MNKLIFCLFALASCFLVRAQDNKDIEKAKHIFKLLQEEKGDSVYAWCNAQVKAAVTADQFTSMMQTLEGQMGKFKEIKDWQTKQVQGIQLTMAEVVFEKMPLMFVVAFDPDGKLNTIRLMPKSPALSSTAVPLPDKVKETEITVKTGEYALPGLFCYPEGISHFPIVVLLHGSGPNDRDETIGPNKPFRDLAYGLAQQGIATLRYDKRTKVYGMKSVPEGEELTIMNEVVEDALSALTLAATFEGADKRRIYLLGHSLGAMLAPLIASQSKDLKGIILMAGNARRMEDLLVEQMEYLYNASKLLPDKAGELDLLRRQVANVKNIGTPAYIKELGLPLLPLSYWENLNRYDQVQTARTLHLPILILQGERDYQVTMTDFALWKTALSNSSQATFHSYPSLNHLFMEGTGLSLPSEYMQPGAIPSYVITDIARWIKEQ